MVTIHQPEIHPKYPGGYDSLKSFVKKNLKYPKSHYQGVVIIRFNVNTDGKLSDFQIVRGSDSEANKEVLKLFEKMPAWIPATLGGEPIKKRITFPINISFN